MRAKKEAPTAHDRRSMGKELISFEAYISGLSSRKSALARLADTAPDWAFDRAILDRDHPKLRLLLGWRRQRRGQGFREAVSEAHVFATGAFISDLLRGLRIRSPQATATEPRRLVVSLNASEIHSEPLTGNGWVTARVDLPVIESQIKPRNLLTIEVRGGGKDLQSNLFHVAPPTGIAAFGEYLTTWRGGIPHWPGLATLGRAAWRRLAS